MAHIGHIFIYSLMGIAAATLVMLINAGDGLLRSFEPDEAAKQDQEQSEKIHSLLQHLEQLDKLDQLERIKPISAHAVQDSIKTALGIEKSMSQTMAGAMVGAMRKFNDEDTHKIKQGEELKKLHHTVQQWKMVAPKQKDISQLGEKLNQTSSHIETYVQQWQADAPKQSDINQLGEKLDQLIKAFDNIQNTVVDQSQNTVQAAIEQLKTDILEPMKTSIEDNTAGVRAQQESNRALIENVNQASERIEQSIEKLADFPEQLSTQIGNAIGKMETQLVEAIKTHGEEQNRHIQTSLLKFERIAGQIATGVSGMISGIQQQERYLNTFKTQLDESIKDIGKEIKVSMTTAQVLLKQTIEETSREQQRQIQITLDGLTGINTDIKNSVGTMNDVVRAQKENLDEFNTALKTNQEEFNEEWKKNIKNIGEEITGSMTTAEIMLKETIKETGGAMEKALTAVGENVQKTVGDSLQTFKELQSGMNDILNNFNTETKTNLENMSRQLADIGKNAEVLINQASSNLKDTLGDIDQKLFDTAKTLETQLTTFREEYQTALTQFFAKQEQHLEQTLGKHVNNLNEVTTNLGQEFTTFTEAQQGLLRIQSASIERFNQSAITAQGLLSKIEGVARELNQGHEEQIDKLKRIAQSMGKYNETVQGLPDNFAQSWNKLHNHYQESFTNLDGGLKEAVQALSSAVDGLNVYLPSLTNRK